MDKASKIKQIDEELKKLEDRHNELNNQRGKGLEILNPQKMSTKLPILLAQLQTGNNSQKLKNDICQLINSL